MITRLSITFLLTLIAAAAGCGQGTTQQGTLYSVDMNKSLECYLSDSIEAVHAAALASMQDAGYTVDWEAIDTREAQVEGRTALDRVVRIRSFKQGENVTKVDVYVQGDGAAAKELLDSIEQSAG